MQRVLLRVKDSRASSMSLVGSWKVRKCSAFRHNGSPELVPDVVREEAELPY